MLLFFPIILQFMHYFLHVTCYLDPSLHLSYRL